MNKEELYRRMEDFRYILGTVRKDSEIEDVFSDLEFYWSKIMEMFKDG